MSKPGWCDMQAFASSTRIAHNGLLKKKQQLIEFWSCYTNIVERLSRRATQRIVYKCCANFIIIIIIPHRAFVSYCCICINFTLFYTKDALLSILMCLSAAAVALSIVIFICCCHCSITSCTATLDFIPLLLLLMMFDMNARKSW